jgi:predicted O-methyltransferase YrrM
MDLCSSLRYIQYVILSRHRKGHGIHSPFVFELVSCIFRNKIEPDIVCSIEKIRKKLIADRRSIVVNDLGAGSARMKTNLRKVSDIVRYSAVSRKYGIFLSNMSRAFGKPLILEFGTSFGISTMYMAASSPETTVYTMEGCLATSGIAEENFKESGFANIRLLNGPFEDLLPRIKSEKVCPGLVFIDGNHMKEHVVNYFNQVAEMSDNKTVVIIDDINYSREMGEAWSVIKNHRNVTFSVDIFRMGIVFFRKGMTRFNYVIRY